MGGAGRAEDTAAVGPWGIFLYRMMRWLKPIKTALDPSLKKAVLYLWSSTGIAFLCCELAVASCTPLVPFVAHPLLYLRTGTGAYPYNGCGQRGWDAFCPTLAFSLPSLPFALLSPLIRL